MSDIPGHSKNPAASTKVDFTARVVDQLDDTEFGIPPSLLVGFVTSLFGAGAGVLSLVIFFYVWNPDAYVSSEWLGFVLIGAIMGFFLRLERPLIRELYRRKL